MMVLPSHVVAVVVQVAGKPVVAVAVVVSVAAAVAVAAAAVQVAADAVQVQVAVVQVQVALAAVVVSVAVAPFAATMMKIDSWLMFLFYIQYGKCIYCLFCSCIGLDYKVVH